LTTNRTKYTKSAPFPWFEKSGPSKVVVFKFIVHRFAQIVSDFKGKEQEKTW